MRGSDRALGHWSGLRRIAPILTLALPPRTQYCDRHALERFTWPHQALARVGREFMRTHICPSTGWACPKCSGYRLDHIKPLECGGADSSENMQDQAVEAAKIKDRTERLFRLPR
jgi:hypothetical protein